MKRSPRSSAVRGTHGLSGMPIFALTLVAIFVVDAMAQPATGPAKHSQNTVTAPVYGPSIPKGFMDLEFGISLEDAEKLLATRNYKFVKRQGWQLILTNVPLAGFSAEEVKLSFSSEAGFNKGEALIKVVCDKSNTQGVEAFDKISRTIHSKYRKFPKVEEKLTKEKKATGRWSGNLKQRTTNRLPAK